MEIKEEIMQQEHELSEDDRNQLATKLANNFAEWDNDRNEQITTARAIMQETYLNQPKRDFGKGLEWKSDVKLNGLYNIKRAKKAIIWDDMWANPAEMFEVRGTNEQTEQQAKSQKASIVDSLNKMNVGQQFDDAIDNLFDIGEMIFKTDWEQRKKVVKRQNKTIGWQLMNVIRSMQGAGYETAPMKDVEIPYYENARVESISPFMFVFDHTKYKLKNKDSWNSCIKIYKRFDTLDNIKANKLYKITPEQIEQLSNTEESGTEQKELIDLRDENCYSGQYSILYAHGDFKINGKTYKNYIAEVLAGKFLIRFEENPMYINPFIFCALEYDPLTKRGIPQLKASMGLCAEEEILTNTAFDVQKLTANPPCWVNEDLVDENNSNPNGDIILAPGKYIKVENGYNGALPVRVEVSSAGIGDLLGLLGQKIADISSVSSVNYGNIEDTKRTATELSLADKGSSSQASKELDTIYQDFVIPMIENVAELLAMFKDGIDYVYANEKGKNLEYKITNIIRQSEYTYYYEDRNAIFDRRHKVQELYNLASGCAGNPELFKMLDWKELITSYIEAIGFDNVERYLAQDGAVTQFADKLRSIPANMQDQVVAMLDQNLNQMAQAYQMQQEQAEMQAKAQKQVMANAMREQAREQLEQQQMQQEQEIDNMGV